MHWRLLGPSTVAAAFLLVAMLTAGCPSQPPVGPTDPRPPRVEGKSHSENTASSAAGSDSHATGTLAAPPLFQDWGQPTLTLVLTGDMWGYLEPCGCAGIEHLKGGVGRRHDLLNQLRAKEWHPVPLDLGSLIRRQGPQQEIKYDFARRALLKMGYGALAFGEKDLQFLTSDTLLINYINSTDEETGQDRLYVSANVVVPGAEDLPKFRIVEAHGQHIGVTAIFGNSLSEHVANSQCEITDSKQALAEVMPQLKEAGCDILVLLSHATIEESRELAAAFPDFAVVATAKGADEPPPEPEVLNDGRTWLVELGHKGMYACVVGFFAEDGEDRRYQRVALDSRFQVTPEMEQIMTDYQSQLQGIVETQGFEGLGLYAELHPRATDEDDPRGFYVGAKRCGECHKKAYATWRDRGRDPKVAHAHFKATDTIKTLGRMYDPECLACHTTGWDPKEYRPYHSGFLNLLATPELVGNSCENCHGPGKAHSDAEEGKNQALKDALRLEMKQDRGQAATGLCRSCHDLDNSPDFDFETYWPKVEHRGKD